MKGKKEGRVYANELLVAQPKEMETKLCDKLYSKFSDCNGIVWRTNTSVKI